MKRFFTKFQIAVALILIGFSASAQFSNIIIANGGKFEFSQPYADRATIGAYNPINKQYWVFDTIQVESVQDIVVDGNFAYLAATDSIIKYDLTTYTRVNQVYFAGIQSLTIHGNNLFVGRMFGTGAFLEVFDKNTLQSIFSVPEIGTTVYGVAVIGDSAYIPYNQKGTVDQFPPYQVFNDTLGKIAVVNLVSQSFVRDIMLDTIGVSAKQVYTYANQIYVVCEGNGMLANYNPVSDTTIFNSISAVKGIAQIDSLIYLNYDTGLGSYDVKNGQIINNSILPPTFSVVETIDTLQQKFYVNTTDYSSYGSSFGYDFTGNLTDSFTVNISPEAMDVFYFSSNLAPIALNDTIIIEQNSASISKAVLLNDFDANADSLTLTILTNPVNGITTVSGTDIVYTVNAEYVGIDVVQYKICDATSCDSAWVNITVNALSGISATTKGTAIAIYPNPTNNILNLTGLSAVNFDYAIADINGKTVAAKKKTSSSVIDISELQAGIYFLHLKNNKQTTTMKFVKL